MARHRSASIALTAIPVDQPLKGPHILHRHVPSSGLRARSYRKTPFLRRAAFLTGMHRSQGVHFQPHRSRARLGGISHWHLPIKT